MELPTLDRLAGIIEPMLNASRVPGAAIAIVYEGKTVFAGGFGQRDDTGLPVTADTLYPIASTSKAINATLIGMLVDDGVLGWDVPVQHYLPRFKLADPVRSPLVTVRDLLTMRTGLPRHDWLWLGNPMVREDLVERMEHLELSAGFRERFQYNNLMPTLAGHVAETVTGKDWDTLVKERILDPLGMTRTIFTVPTEDDFTQSWVENETGELVRGSILAADCTAPSGGSIYSSVNEMAHWVAFNLNGGKAPDGRQLIKPETLKEIHRGQMAMGDWGGRDGWATYGLGWMADPYNGHHRLFHGGALHQVDCEVAFYPDQQIGMVSFTNFGAPAVASLINEHTFDSMMGTTPKANIDTKVAAYKKMLEGRLAVNRAPQHVEGTSPSHAIGDYAGLYRHAGYGDMVIEQVAGGLRLRRGMFDLPLEHRHYDTWAVVDASPLWPHAQHPFEVSNNWTFQTNAAGEISALTVLLEAMTAPIRFEKQPAD